MIKDSVIVQLSRFEDHRGYFAELQQDKRYEALGIKNEWCQVNSSHSVAGVIRGLHVTNFAKLITCVSGRIFDVVVDVRKDSHTYLKWMGVDLDAKNSKQVYVPPGCAHGFFAYESSIVIYLQDGIYNPQTERSFHWDSLGVTWPAGPYFVSENDAKAPPYV